MGVAVHLHAALRSGPWALDQIARLHDAGFDGAAALDKLAGEWRQLNQSLDKILREGKLGTIGLVEIYCYYHMRASGNPPDTEPPANLDYEMWTGPAPLRPYNQWVHPRGWRAFMEYSNGIVGDMCVHMLDMVRWMMDLGSPATISSGGGTSSRAPSRASR